MMSRVQRFVADAVAWRINRHYEKCALALLERAHLGASIGWISEIVEVRGRHALAVAHH